jgi:DNA-binding MarR family transcriptional regulator
VSSTPEGEALFRRAEAAARDAESAALAGLSAPEIATLKGLLRKALWGPAA